MFLKNASCLVLPRRRVTETFLRRLVSTFRVPEALVSVVALFVLSESTTPSSYNSGMNQTFVCLKRPKYPLEGEKSEIFRGMNQTHLSRCTGSHGLIVSLTVMLRDIERVICDIEALGRVVPP